MSIRLLGLYTGRAAPLGEDGRLSAIVKSAVSTAHIGPTGLDGDQQADLSVHGGPDKAVHLYPAEHYARLAEAYPAVADRLGPGFLGENLSLTGLLETTLRVGDRLRVGEVLLEVSQPRSPCWKIDARFGCKGVAATVARQRLTGWYCRVIETGGIRLDSRIEPQPGDSEALTLDALMVLMASHRPDPAQLRAAAVPALTASWRKRLLDRADWLQQNQADSVQWPPAHTPGAHG